MKKSNANEALLLNEINSGHHGIEVAKTAQDHISRSVMCRCLEEVRRGVIDGDIERIGDAWDEIASATVERLA